VKQLGKGQNIVLCAESQKRKLLQGNGSANMSVTMQWPQQTCMQQQKSYWKQCTLSCRYKGGERAVRRGGGCCEDVGPGAGDQPLLETATKQLSEDNG
jgi:hypothetical protein